MCLQYVQSMLNEKYFNPPSKMGEQEENEENAYLKGGLIETNK